MCQAQLYQGDKALHFVCLSVRAYGIRDQKATENSKLMETSNWGENSTLKGQKIKVTGNENEKSFFALILIAREYIIINYPGETHVVAWMDSECRRLRRNSRRLERKYRRTGSATDRFAWVEHERMHHKVYRQGKRILERPAN